MILNNEQRKISTSFERIYYVIDYGGKNCTGAYFEIIPCNGTVPTQTANDLEICFSK
jgi:hypothetical protein